ncbi:hypothetical protein B4907_20730 [Yersinia kristensenii]|nr:hypothetical protein B4907_20730 [Yersinia kristensenii]
MFWRKQIKIAENKQPYHFQGGWLKAREPRQWDWIRETLKKYNYNRLKLNEKNAPNTLSARGVLILN